MGCVMEAEHISVGFAGKQVLRDISFAMREGEIFGLLGPSGAGKTTLIKILTGQLRQDAGYASLLGADTRALSAGEHEKIGIMMDCMGLYERLSAYDNLAFYAELCHAPRCRVSDMLKRVGLYEARRTAVSKLSKGMKNRLSLTRALINDVKLLFLDEPTSGLDPAAAREIHRILARQRENGTAIFLTTHNMYEAENLCDHVALLNEGRLVEYGRPAEIRRKYNHLNRLHVTLKGGERVTLENSRASASLVKEYMEREQIESIHSTEPTLEAVFLELTGKELNGYESYGGHL